MNYQGACDAEEAQPLLECRGILFRRLLYLIQPRAESKAPIKKSDIGSVVTSPNEPEVPRVIAETHKTADPQALSLIVIWQNEATDVGRF